MLSPDLAKLLQAASGPFEFSDIVAVAVDGELNLLAVENRYATGTAKVYVLSSDGTTVVLASEEPLNEATRRKAVAHNLRDRGGSN